MMNSDRANVGIVLDAHGNAEKLFQVLLDGNVLPTKVGSENDAAGFGIHRPGSSDSDSLHLVELKVALIDCVFDTTRNALDDFVGSPLGLGADAGGANRFKGHVEHPGVDLRATEIDA